MSNSRSRCHVDMFVTRLPCVVTGRRPRRLDLRQVLARIRRVHPQPVSRIGGPETAGHGWVGDLDLVVAEDVARHRVPGVCGDRQVWVPHPTIRPAVVGDARGDQVAATHVQVQLQAARKTA